MLVPKTDAEMEPEGLPEYIGAVKRRLCEVSNMVGVTTMTAGSGKEVAGG
jgi:hypothetical protein